MVGTGSHRAENGPAAEHTVGERDRGAVDGGEGDAVRGARGEVGDGARGADEVVDGEHRAGLAGIARGDDELRTTGHEINGAEGLRAGRLLASAQLEQAAPQVDHGRVIDTIQIVRQAVGILEVEIGGIDVQRGGTREGRVAIHHGQAAVDQRLAGVVAGTPEVQGIQARAGEAHVARDAGGDLAAEVIGVDQEMAVAVVAGDQRAAVGDRRLGEDTPEQLGLAVEVEGTTDGREVVIGLNGVGRTELDRALVDGEKAAQGVGADCAEPVDRRGDRGDGERARARLDERWATAADAVAARERGTDGQVADRPDVEPAEAVDLVDHAAGDRRGAARADEDAAGAEVELHAIGESKTRAAFDGQRVALGVGRHGQAAAGDRGEEDVRIRGDALGGATEDRGVDFVFTRIEGTDAVARRTRGDEREVRGKRTRVIQVDESPRQDAAILGTGSAAFTGDRRGGGELDGRTAAGRS